MSALRPLIAAALTGTALLTAPAVAPAAPPANDNYLASTRVESSNGNPPPEYRDNPDTTEATTQADLFNPSATGQPFGGAGPENTKCRSTTFGKTVWYDIAPQTAGGIDVSTVAAFDSVITLYEWNPANSLITRTVTCADTAGPKEELLADVAAGKRYTLQVGGVTGPAGPAGGPLAFELLFFQDTDGDKVLDEAPDKCRTLPGIRRFGGCPPTLPVSASINYDNAPNGIRLTRLVVDHMPKGAKVRARCSRCGLTQTRKATKAGTVSLTKFFGRVAPVGASIQLFVTMGNRGKGDYRFGATGKYFMWPVTAQHRTGTKVERCLNRRTNKVERCG